MHLHPTQLRFALAPLAGRTRYGGRGVAVVRRVWWGGNCQQLGLAQLALLTFGTLLTQLPITALTQRAQPVATAQHAGI